jgi:hypothetical protein
MSKPSLVNILRNTLQQVEDDIVRSEDEPAVSELRKQIALSVSEMELVKDTRSAIAESDPKLFVVTRPRPRLVEGGTEGSKARRRSIPDQVKSHK